TVCGWGIATYYARSLNKNNRSDVERGEPDIVEIQRRRQPEARAVGRGHGQSRARSAVRVERLPQQRRRRRKLRDADSPAFAEHGRDQQIEARRDVDEGEPTLDPAAPAMPAPQVAREDGRVARRVGDELLGLAHRSEERRVG